MGQIWQGLISLFQQAFDFFFSITGSYGLAIILLTVTVRLILLPLTYSQVIGLRRMQMLQPELQKIQKKHKGDQKKINEETMKLYQEKGVNPAAGCLPLVVQLPFLYAFFQMLREYQFAGTGGFLWLHSLAAPDALWVLPILAAATTFWQTKISTPMTGGPQAGAQQTMLYIMPFFILYITRTLPAGLGIYWVVSNLFSVAQQYLVMRQPVEPSGGKA